MKLIKAEVADQSSGLHGNKISLKYELSTQLDD